MSKILYINNKVVAAFNQEKALVEAFSVITNLRMQFGCNSGLASETRLTVVLVSSSMEVKREEAAYSALTLVADCGGLLGLFIGFNFLMIWDLVVIVGIKISQYFNTLTR